MIQRIRTEETSSGGCGSADREVEKKLVDAAMSMKLS